MLEVSTWKGSGVVYWAEHYYGKLKGSLAVKEPRRENFNWDTYEDVEVEYELGEKEALALNKESAEGGLLGDYKVGETSTRFFSEEKLMVEAVETARRLGYDALLLGSYSCCSPQKVLFGPKMDELNAIWEKYEACYEHTNDPPEELLKPFEDEWTALAYAVGIADKVGGPQFHRSRG